MRNFTLLVLFLALAFSASGSTITIGGTDANNVFPFSWYAQNARYQQFYTGIPAGFRISEISFRSLDDLFYTSDPYLLDATIGLGTATGQTLGFGTNLGTDYRVVYNSPMIFSPGANRDEEGFDLHFYLTNPYVVSSPEQVLVLDITLNTSVDAFVAFAAGGDDPRSSRVYESSGGEGPVGWDNLSLETKFSDVPEPGTWALLGSGLVGMAVVRRRRK